MNTYVPIFGKIVDSSLWRESDLVVKVYLTMLAKKDMDHVVRANAYMIGEWAKKTEKETLEALKVLSSPDRRRIEPQPNEGRRIKKVEDGWLILNGQYYEDMARDVARKFRKAKWARENRVKEKAANEPEKNNIKDLIEIHEQHAEKWRRELELEPGDQP